MPAQKGIKNTSGRFVMKMGRNIEVKRHSRQRPPYFSKVVLSGSPHLPFGTIEFSQVVSMFCICGGL
jgi:hypothetical protein